MQTLSIDRFAPRIAGLMDPAYFVGKNQLLKWLNDLFDAGVTKVLV